MQPHGLHFLEYSLQRHSKRLMINDRPCRDAAADRQADMHSLQVNEAFSCMHAVGASRLAAPVSRRRVHPPAKLFHHQSHPVPSYRRLHDHIPDSAAHCSMFHGQGNSLTDISLQCNIPVTSSRCSPSPLAYSMSSQDGPTSQSPRPWSNACGDGLAADIASAANTTARPMYEAGCVLRPSGNATLRKRKVAIFNPN